MVYIYDSFGDGGGSLEDEMQLGMAIGGRIIALDDDWLQANPESQSKMASLFHCELNYSFETDSTTSSAFGGSIRPVYIQTSKLADTYYQSLASPPLEPLNKPPEQTATAMVHPCPQVPSPALVQSPALSRVSSWASIESSSRNSRYSTPDPWPEFPTFVPRIRENYSFNLVRLKS